MHAVLPPRRGARRRAVGAGAGAADPAGLARSALRQLRPSTRVEVSEGAVVADRPAYELILTPRGAATRVGSVHLYLDGATKLPLGVQVFARGSDTPAIDVAYSSIRFGQPMAHTFSFTPPAGATVRTLRPGTLPVRPRRPRRPAARTGPTPPAAAGRPSGPTGSATDAAPGSPRGRSGRRCRRSADRWGSGRLLEGDLASVLVTDDGRLYVGAVDPAALYAAAGK